jgi:hypothetical protein
MWVEVARCVFAGEGMLPFGKKADGGAEDRSRGLRLMGGGGRGMTGFDEGHRAISAAIHGWPGGARCPAGEVLFESRDPGVTVDIKKHVGGTVRQYWQTNTGPAGGRSSPLYVQFHVLSMHLQEIIHTHSVVANHSRVAVENVTVAARRPEHNTTSSNLQLYYQNLH